MKKAKNADFSVMNYSISYKSDLLLISSYSLKAERCSYDFPFLKMFPLVNFLFSNYHSLYLDSENNLALCLASKLGAETFINTPDFSCLIN